jgi:hypothetical protein
MKWETTNPLQIQIGQFWKRFRSMASALARRPEDPLLVTELDRQVRNFDRGLSWEIGPGITKDWQLVISPNLNRDLYKLARDIVSRAPVLPNWEFYSARQPKSWNYKFQFGPDRLPLDASHWSFVLLNYPYHAHEVLLKADNLPPLSEDEKRQAAAIVLESILGEELLMDRIVAFELVNELEPRFLDRQRPIQTLPQAVTG